MAKELIMTSPAFSPETAGTIVYSAEFGSPPDATELNVLTQFSQAQFAYGQQIGGQDPSIYAFQALGVALASTATNFQNTFGPVVDGDVQFLVDAYASVFGQPGSEAQIQQFSDQLNFFNVAAIATKRSSDDARQYARSFCCGICLCFERHLCSR
jgi:hypothetical protein